MWLLKGTSVPSICGCTFLTRTALPLAPPEFKHYWLCLSTVFHVTLDRSRLLLNPSISVNSKVDVIMT